MPFKMMQEKIDKFKKDMHLKILFLHIREPEEIKKAVDAFEAKTLLITNNREEQVVTNRADAGV